MQNLFSTLIPAEVLAQALDLIRQLIALLAPYLKPLTMKERQTLVKMGDGSVAFVADVRDLVTNDPKLAPDFVDLAEFRRDADAVAGLNPLNLLLAGLALDLDSTEMLAGSDAMVTALAIYEYIKFLAKNNRPGAQAALAVLSKRFPGNGGGRPGVTLQDPDRAA